MPFFSSEFLRKHTAGTWHGVAGGAGVNGFSIDTRTLRRGECFVALKTEKRDGHDFLADAARAGAGAALVERPVAGVTDAAGKALPQLVVADTAGALRKLAAAHRDTLRCPVIGITGSAGKTSTKDLLARILGAPDTGDAPDGRARGDVLVTAGNLNNTLGVPLTLLRADPKQHRRAVVVECGISECGEMDVIGAVLRPDIAIITNVLPAHLNGLGTLEDIAREKATLARYVRKSDIDGSGTVIFPATLLEYDAFARIRNADVRPVSFEGDPDKGIFSIPSCSEGMMRNATLATIAARSLNYGWDKIKEATMKWKPSANRGEWRTAGDRKFYADCYNANPAAVLDAADFFNRQTSEIAPLPAEEQSDPSEIKNELLAAVDRYRTQSRVFVLGGMNELGPQSVAHHERTGAKLPLRAGDLLILFGGDAPHFATGVLAADSTAAGNGFQKENIIIAETLEAVRAAIAGAPANAPVFIKGSRSYALERLLDTP